MEKIKYAVIPRFVVKKKGKVLDVANIEKQFTDWIKKYTSQGYVISRNTTLSAILEPGCLSRLLLRKQVAFVDFPALEFQASDKAIDYKYRVAPEFAVKAKKLKKKEKKKISSFDLGLALFEEHREEFERLINEHISKLAKDGLKYNTSTIIRVAVEPGCLGKLFGKKGEHIDFEAYEFIKTSAPITYKCKIFPRFRSEEAKFSFDELEKDISTKVAAETECGYELVGKIVFFGFFERGCLEAGERVSVDAFLFAKA